MMEAVLAHSSTRGGPPAQGSEVSTPSHGYRGKPRVGIAAPIQDYLLAACDMDLSLRPHQSEGVLGAEDMAVKVGDPLPARRRHVQVRHGLLQMW
jgi:hypothetical protein